jgi:hypothetical protein
MLLFTERGCKRSSLRWFSMGLVSPRCEQYCSCWSKIFSTKASLTSERINHRRLERHHRCRIAAGGGPMNTLHNWFGLNPMAVLPSIAILFLIASIAGWYVGNLIQWLRRT